MKRKHAVPFAIVLCLMLGAWTCNQSTTQKVATVERDFAAAVQAAQATEIAAHQAGKIDDATHLAIQRYFLQVAQAGKAVDAAILAGNKAGILAALDSAAASIGTLLTQGVGNVKDPTVKAEIQTAVLLAQSIISSAKAFVQ